MATCSLHAQSPSKQSQRIIDLYTQGKYQLVVFQVDSILNEGDSTDLSYLFKLKADAYYFLNDIQQSKRYYLQTLSVIDQYPLDTISLIEATSHTGFIYKYLGQYLEAIPYYQRALSIARAAGESIEVSNQLYNLGKLHAHLGRYDKSYDYFNECYRIDFANKDSSAIAHDLASLGDLKLSMSDFTEAIGYYKQSLSIKEPHDDNHNAIPLRIGEMANAYLKANQIDSAIKYNQIAIEACRELGDSLSLMKQVIIKSEILLKIQDLDQAERLITSCLEYFSKNENNLFEVNSLFVLIDIYITTGKYVMASSRLDQVTTISMKLNLPEHLIKAYDYKANLLETQGRLSEAITYHKLFQQAKDSLNQMEKQNAILLLNQEYQMADKEQQIQILSSREEIAALKLERRQKRITWLVICLILTVAGAIYIYYANRQRHLLAKKLLQSEINELRGQLKLFVEGEADTKKAVENLLKKSTADFSNRESEILELALTDLSNGEIAEKTFVSVNTVKFHLRNIYSKLGVSNRQQIKEFIVHSNN